MRHVIVLLVIGPASSKEQAISTGQGKLGIALSDVNIFKRSSQIDKYIEDIYFFEVNTKYISSSVVKKISIFNECVARVKMLIFSPHETSFGH